MSPQERTEIIDPNTSKLHVHVQEEEAIKLAEESLTAEEREIIQRRQDAVDAQQKSQAKGKAVEPRTWGIIALDETELDPETQEVLLRNYKARKVDQTRDCDTKKGKSEKVPKKRPDDNSEPDDKQKTPEMSGPGRAASAGHAQPQK